MPIRAGTVGKFVKTRINDSETTTLSTAEADSISFALPDFPMALPTMGPKNTPTTEKQAITRPESVPVPPST